MRYLCQKLVDEVYIVRNGHKSNHSDNMIALVLLPDYLSTPIIGLHVTTGRGPDGFIITERDVRYGNIIIIIITNKYRKSDMNPANPALMAK